MISFGKVIKELRKNRRLTQTELSKALGVSKSMISSYESDSRAPSYNVLIKLARFFNVPMDYMFGFKNKQTCSLDSLDPDEQEIILMLIKKFEENKTS